MRKVTIASDDKWWNGLSREQQRDYIEKHPRSKYAKNALNKDKSKKPVKESKPTSVGDKKVGSKVEAMKQKLKDLKLKLVELNKKFKTLKGQQKVNYIPKILNCNYAITRLKRKIEKQITIDNLTKDKERAKNIDPTKISHLPIPDFTFYANRDTVDGPLGGSTSSSISTTGMNKAKKQALVNHFAKIGKQVEKKFGVKVNVKRGDAVNPRWDTIDFSIGEGDSRHKDRDLKAAKYFQELINKKD